MKIGRFVVLEGPDGSGTTTHAQALFERLKTDGHNVILTSEPSAGPIGTMIRRELSTGDLSPYALQLLFTADRAWHTERVIEPALRDGTTVICDRFALSTLVYGVASGLDPNLLESMNKNFIQPDLQIILLPPLSIALQRVRKRKELELFEEDSFQKKVHDLYGTYAAKLSLPIIDTNQERRTVEECVLDHFLRPV